MALPPGVTYVTNIRGSAGADGAPGERGPKGETGTISHADVELLPAGSPASVSMVGPLSDRGVLFRLPAGMPGADAVPAMEAVAAWVGGPGPVRDQVSGVARDEAARVCHILPVWGQSLAKGSNDDYDPINIDTVDPRILMFPATGPLLHHLVEATVPLPNVPGDGGAGLGPAFPFAKAMLARYPASHVVLPLPYARSNTGFELSGGAGDARWKPVAGKTDLLLLAIEHTLAAIEAVIAAGYLPVIDAIWWQQGEADSNAAVAEAVHADNIDTHLIDRTRTLLPLARSAVFLIGQMAKDRISSQAGTAGVNAAIIATPLRKPLTAFVPSPPPGYTNDGTHMTAMGTRMMVRAGIAAYERGLQNRPGVVPDVPPRVRVTSTGVEWDAPAGRVTGYDVVSSVNGGVEATTATTATSLPLDIQTTDSVRVRVRALAEAGPGDFAYTSRPSAPDLLEAIVFARAYSVRRLPGYSGKLFTIRRSSDNAELAVDSVAEAVAFVGSGSGYVSVWWDQSGNGRHLVQATLARQPRLINAGVVQTAAGRPSLAFSRLDGCYMWDDEGGAWNAGSFSLAAVQAFYDSNAGAVLVGESSSTNANAEWVLNAATGLTLTQQIRGTSGTIALAPGTVAEPPQAFNAASPRHLNVIVTPTLFRKRVGGVSLADLAYTAPSMALDRFVVGARLPAGSPASVRGALFSELLVSHSAWTDTIRNRVEGSQSGYWTLN